MTILAQKLKSDENEWQWLLKSLLIIYLKVGSQINRKRFMLKSFSKSSLSSIARSESTYQLEM